MTFPAPKIRRAALYALVVLLAVTLAARVFTNRRDTGVQSLATHEAGRIQPNVTKAESLQAQRLAEPVVTKAREAPAPVDPPKSPAVAALYQQFHQGNGKVLHSTIADIVKRPVGKRVEFDAAGLKLSGVIDSRVESEAVVHMGVTLDGNLGRFVMSLREDSRILASVMFNGESNAFAIHGRPIDGAWKLEATTVAGIACRPEGTTYPFVAAEAGLLVKRSAPITRNGPVAAPPILNSNPSSRFVLYMDFDGEKVTSPSWNSGKLIDAAPDPRADDVTYVTNVWKRTSEDYAPFDINVTTDRAVFDAAAVSDRVMCVCTPTNTAAPGAGGVAYLQSFGQDIPCWNFNIYDEYGSADTVSHEVGHTVGLSHDGTTDGVEYYGGHGGTGPYSWAPIMGAAWANANDEEVTQFSKGEYPKANNKEDDLVIISTQNGFGYREDDKGDTKATASPLKFDQGQAADSGIIGQNTDEDWFVFSTSGGDIALNVNVIDVNSSENPQRGANLGVAASLYDSAGNLVFTSNPDNSLDAPVNYYAVAGIYYMKLHGVAKGTLSTGFSDYDSLGQYTITGTVPQENLITVDPPSSTVASQGGTSQFKVTTTFSWTWTSSDSWVTSTEAASQKGNQIFEYSVERNTTAGPRTATITLNAGSFSVTHTINQEAPGLDDHGNTIGTATLIDQVSVTEGKIEMGGDLDVFRINVKGFGNLTVKSAGNTDTFGQLLDFAGKVIASNDNALNPSFRITHPVSTGTYYVRVRHSFVDGTGSYQVISSFESTQALTISVAKRTVGPDGGSASLEVVSNVDWAWSSDVAWIQSDEPVSQSKGQVFEYSVIPTTIKTNRVGHIIFTAGTTTVVHTVYQTGITIDDHSNYPSKATAFVPSGTIAGRIDYEGDVDVFRIPVEGSGTLTVTTTGTLDTYGELFASDGRTLIDFNDDFGSANFRISHSVDAGTYYVKVRHFTNSGLGNYKLKSSFTPASTIYLKYGVMEGGTLLGNAEQGVIPGGSGTRVKAVSNNGYSFLRWSDGVKWATRTDRNVHSNISVVASFIRSMSVKIQGGEFLSDGETVPIDLGIAAVKQTISMNFIVRNNSKNTLTGLNIAESGSGMADWWHAPLSSTTIAPGKSLVLTIRMRSSSIGYKSATFTIIAKEQAFAPFPLHVMALVEAPIGGLPTVKPVSNGDRVNLNQTSDSGNGKSGFAREASSTSSTHHAAEDCWITLSPDGLFRHQFQRTRGDRSKPRFWISTDGVEWNEATVTAVHLLSTSDSSETCEAIISPPDTGDLVILLSGRSQPDKSLEGEP